MKKILLICLMIGSSSLFAQQIDSLLVQEFPVIKNNIFQQRNEINAIHAKLNDYRNLINQQSSSISQLEAQAQELSRNVDSLNKVIDLNSKNIISNSEELGSKLQEADNNFKSKMIEIDNSLSKNQLYWIIGSLLTLLLGGLLYWLLGRRINHNMSNVESTIKNTKAALQEESVKLDNKLIEVLETQLKVQQEESQHGKTIPQEEIDHTLALKVADEIVRMQKNISRMDDGIKGLKPLEKGIERIQANFAANGYEMINLLNKDYDDRMNIDVINFIEDEDLESGKKIITKIIKPQVNYNGILIQRAQVEVTQN